MDNGKTPGKKAGKTGAPDMRPSNAETRLARLLEDGSAERVRPEAEAPRRLSPRYEVRIVTERDPLMEETRLYREMADEIDGQYDLFAPRDGDRR
jgi:hypothetical protein